MPASASASTGNPAGRLEGEEGGATRAFAGDVDKGGLGDEFKRVLARHCEDYVRIIAKITHKRKEYVLEALHDVVGRILAMLTARPEALGGIAAWKPYLIRAVVNEVREKRRQLVRRKRVLLFFGELEKDGRQIEPLLKEASEPGPAEQAELNELARLAWNAVANLPERQREVIMRRCRGEDYDEIARELRIASSTAMAHYHFGIAKLRRRLRRAA